MSSRGMKEKISGFSSQLLFIELELAAIDEDRFQQALSDPDFYFFLPWLSRLRAFAPHQLETRLEQMLVERAPAGHNAWVRLFDETATALRFPFQGTEVTEAEILNKLSDPSADIRKEAGQSLSGVMQSNQRLFSLILNVIAKDKEIEDNGGGLTVLSRHGILLMMLMTPQSILWSVQLQPACQISRIAIIS